ncbi:MAG: adenylate/guanylate cyclase domain-containing protein [Nitrospirae bacterium]|nr:adenylate/guanylate cyclase domain-containing protein [Nitrospirota bacterium]MBF0535546.1 adenylate/guanylate cyclase domain-containing protein [Nitrospirota bacterium]MBF0617427.1 adenylate/guanylate cyclase domain-containing protein [Nitrospirota bacterium]
MADLKQLKLRRFLYFLTATITLFYVVLALRDPAFITENLETKLLDLRIYVKNVLKTDDTPKDILIVYVDDKSIKEIGRWPWKRDVEADLLRNISKDAPKVIAVDVMLSETENAASDDKLAETIKVAGNVVLATAFITKSSDSSFAGSSDAPDFLWDSAFMEVKTVSNINWKKWAIKPEKVLPPIEKFARFSSLGHVYTLPDSDGAIRYAILYVNFGTDCYPHLALQTARIALGLKQKDMILFGGSSIKLGNMYIPIDLSGRVIINYRGIKTNYISVSASDVIRGKIEKGFFNNKIVFIGTSALATYDQKVTAVSANSSGVSINANIVENILSTGFLRRSPNVIEIIVICIAGILFGLISRFRAALSSILALICISVYMFFSFYLLIKSNLWLNITYPVAAMVSLFSLQTIVKFLAEERRGRQIRGIFSRYVSPQIVNVLINNPEGTHLGGKQQTLTILFTDIVGFTTISEKLTPEEVVQMLNEYFSDMVEIIFKWGGTLNKFIGDAIMCFWGAPVEDNNHAVHAIKCALNMIAKKEEIQVKRLSEGKAPIDIGIGINSGEVLIGNIGAVGKQMDYTIIGDNVNLCSRVEGLTRKFKVHILISENTFKEIRPHIDSGLLYSVSVKCVGRVAVKGKAQPVSVYDVKGLPTGEASEIVDEIFDEVIYMKDK